jgi:hypothetical protein
MIFKVLYDVQLMETNILFLSVWNVSYIVKIRSIQ